jgi:hypothetical protein
MTMEKHALKSGLEKIVTILHRVEGALQDDARADAPPPTKEQLKAHAEALYEAISATAKLQDDVAK